MLYLTKDIFNAIITFEVETMRDVRHLWRRSNLFLKVDSKVFHLKGEGFGFKPIFNRLTRVYKRKDDIPGTHLYPITRYMLHRTLQVLKSSQIGESQSISYLGGKCF